jgi:hypothetical protein
MKKISYLLAVIMSVTFFMQSCNKDKDPEPAAPVTADAQKVIINMNDNVQIADSDTASLKVAASETQAIIEMVVSSATDLDNIFIMRSVDNGPLTKFKPSGSVTNLLGTGGEVFATSTDTSRSFYVSSGTVKSFTIDVPVTLRGVSTGTDVYVIWITNGAGRFDKPTKNLVLGQAVVTIKYGTTSAVSFSTATINLGDQFAVPGSMLVTTGQVAALNTADYLDAPGSADLALGNLTGGTTKATTYTANSAYLFSPDLRSGLGYTGCATCGTGGAAITEPTSSTGANITFIASYSGTDFATITGAGLEALNVGTSKSVLATVGSVYMFETENGKKGLLKVNSITPETDGNSGDVVNVTVKVRN